MRAGLDDGFCSKCAKFNRYSMMARSSSSSANIRFFIAFGFLFYCWCCCCIWCIYIVANFFGTVVSGFFDGGTSFKNTLQKCSYFFGTALLASALPRPRYAYVRIGPSLCYAYTDFFGAFFVCWSLLICCAHLGLGEVYLLRYLTQRLFYTAYWFFKLFRFLSVFFAKYPFESLYGLLNEIVFFPLMTLLFVAAFRSSIDIGKILRILVYVTFLICLLGVAEYVRQQNIFAGLLPII